MNTQEFAEWLRKGFSSWTAETERRRDDLRQSQYQIGYARGYASALGDAHQKLMEATTLDSSHDLPPTKG